MAPQIICASSLIKEAVVDIIHNSDMPAPDQKRELAYWEGIPDCMGGEPIKSGSGGKGGGGGQRQKRAPSAYNLFIKECLPNKKGAHTEKFKECAADWRKKKGG